MLKRESFLAKIGFDTAEEELPTGPQPGAQFSHNRIFSIFQGATAPQPAEVTETTAYLQDLANDCQTKSADWEVLQTIAILPIFILTPS